MSGSQRFVFIISILNIIVGIVAGIVAMGFKPTYLASLVMPLLMFYCARNIKIQGIAEKAARDLG